VGDRGHRPDWDPGAPDQLSRVVLDLGSELLSRYLEPGFVWVTPTPRSSEPLEKLRGGGAPPPKVTLVACGKSNSHLCNGGCNHPSSRSDAAFGIRFRYPLSVSAFGIRFRYPLSVSAGPTVTLWVPYPKGGSLGREPTVTTSPKPDLRYYSPLGAETEICNQGFSFRS